MPETGAITPISGIAGAQASAGVTQVGGEEGEARPGGGTDDAADVVEVSRATGAEVVEADDVLVEL